MTQTGCGSQLVNSLYYNMVTLTTIGFGEISPVGVGEKVWMSVIMVFGAGMFASTLIYFADMLFGEPEVEDHHLRQIRTRRESQADQMFTSIDHFTQMMH